MEETAFRKMKQSLFTDLLLTDLVSVSPYFRLLNNIRARRQSIHWQAQTQKSHPKKMYQHLSELNTLKLQLLDIQYTNTKTCGEIRRSFNSFGNREQHMVSIFGRCLMPSKNRDVCPIEQTMLTNMAMDNKIKRVTDLTTRILLEIIEKQSKGWFIVFNTLTVADPYMKEVFDKDKRIFEKYILSVTYAIKKQDEKLYGQRKRKTDQLHTYFAVVEEGGKTGRLHFHVLHFLRHLPNHYVDPNYGRKLPDRRAISAMRKHWQRGFSMPIAVRLASQDNFARAGWRWPVTRKESNYEALETSNPLRMARYISKYINKSTEERSKTWKTRLTKGLGTQIIKDVLENLMTRQIEQLMVVSQWQHLEVMGIAIPITITRKLALREYLQRMKSEQQKLHISTTQKSLTELSARPSIVELTRTLTQTKRKYNCSNISSIKVKNLRRMDIFNIQQEFNQVLYKYGYNTRMQEGRGVTWEAR